MPSAPSNDPPVASPAGPALRLVLSCPPGTAGSEEMLTAAMREAAAGRDVRVLLSDRGLDWLDGPWPVRWAAAGVKAAVCAKSARERGLDPKTCPTTVAWSSLATVAREVSGGARLWIALA